MDETAGMKRHIPAESATPSTTTDECTPNTFHYHLDGGMAGKAAPRRDVENQPPAARPAASTAIRLIVEGERVSTWSLQAHRPLLALRERDIDRESAQASKTYRLRDCLFL